MLNFDVQRTGFPVRIGKIELFFDSSIENLRRFFDIEELAQKKLKEAQEKAKHIHFPDKIDAETVKNMDTKTVDAALDLNKEHIAVQYDIIFGDGTFKRVYAKYPDILALEQTLEPIGIAIAKRIEEMEVERSEKVKDRKEEYLNKKIIKKNVV